MAVNNPFKKPMTPNQKAAMKNVKKAGANTPEFKAIMKKGK